MPEGVGYGPQNTASIGKDIHVIGTHAYAYSGAVSFDDSGSTAFEFRSGNYYAVAKLNWDVVGTSTDDVTLTLSLNGINVYKPQLFDANHEIVPSLHFIIPPYTEVKLIFTNNDSTVMEGYAVMKSRIYGKVD